MISIAICDDEERFSTQLHELINRYGQESGEEIRVTVYHDGGELVEQYQTNTDLIFLDIKMNRMNGLMAADKIRKKDTGVSIIFLTSLVKYALEGYKYNATNYIIKPIKYARLKSELDVWMKKFRKEEIPHLIVKNDSGKYKVFYNTIHYIETYKRNLLLHSEEGAIVYYGNMKTMEIELAGYGFVRCHASYLVNLFFVKRVEKLEIELITGEIVSISQTKRKDFMEALAQYWGDKL